MGAYYNKFFKAKEKHSLLSLLLLLLLYFFAGNSRNGLPIVCTSSRSRVG